MMKNALFACALVGLILMTGALPARADMLDDDSIKAVYSSYGASLKKPDDFQNFVRDRFDDKYTLQQNMTRVGAGQEPAEPTVDTLSKDQIAMNSIRQTNKTQITNATIAVGGIRYSVDKKYAYVTYNSVKSGTTQNQIANGMVVTSSFDDAEGCVDELGLKNGTIKIVKSACNGTITIRQ